MMFRSDDPQHQDDPPCESCKWDAGNNCRLTVGCRYEPKDVQTTDTPASATQIGGTHYVSKTVQPWDAMQAWMTPEQFSGFLRGNAIKYLARCDDKGGVDDLRKARHYLDKLIETQAAAL